MTQLIHLNSWEGFLPVPVRTAPQDAAMCTHHLRLVTESEFLHWLLSDSQVRHSRNCGQRDGDDFKLNHYN